MLLVAISIAHAQTQPTKHLPEKVVITLSAAQVIKMDSAIKATANTIDSKTATIGLFNAFGPIYQQISLQLVADTVKQHTKTKQK